MITDSSRHPLSPLSLHSSFNPKGCDHTFFFRHSQCLLLPLPRDGGGMSDSSSAADHVLPACRLLPPGPLIDGNREIPLIYQGGWADLKNGPRRRGLWEKEGECLTWKKRAFSALLSSCSSVNNEVFSLCAVGWCLLRSMNTPQRKIYIYSLIYRHDTLVCNMEQCSY